MASLVRDELGVDLGQVLGAEETKEQVQLGRLHALQPSLTIEDIDAPITETQDPIHLLTFTNLLQGWARAQRGLPRDFAGRLSVRRVARQTMGVVLVCGQLVRRTLDWVPEPWFQEPVEEPPLPTKDVFELAPVRALTFPAKLETERVPLNRGGGVETCAGCQGEKKTRCGSCSGKGRVKCPACRGRPPGPCPFCSGKGVRLDVSGKSVNCTDCRGTGKSICEKCGGDATIKCAPCTGSGSVKCPSCKGAGRVRIRIELVSDVSSIVQHQVRIGDRWRVRVGLWAPDTAVILANAWEWPNDKVFDQISQMLPESAAATAIDLARGILETNNERLIGEKITGLRVELRATIIYRVELEYRRSTYLALVGGMSNRVDFAKPPRERIGSLRWAGRVFGDIWSGRERDGNPLPSRSFLEGVRNGKAHCSDRDLIVPEAVISSEGSFAVTDAGYQVVLPAVGEGLEPVKFHVQLDLDERDEPIWLIRSILGPAFRDRFPEILALSHQLDFGRLAAFRDDDGVDMMVLMDVRPTQWLTAKKMSLILKTLRGQIHSLRHSSVMR